jgi:hypothetical protein
VIDALDECDHHGDIEEILRLLVEAKEMSMINLRIFVTSRPDTPLRLGLGSLPEVVYHRELLQDVPLKLIRRDISIFLRHQLGIVRVKHDLDKDWPADADIQKLVLRADRLFIHAATACRFLKDDLFPGKRLQEMLQLTSASHHSSEKQAMTELDDMYALILSKLFVPGHDEGNKDMARLFRKTVGSIILLFERLTVPALAELLNISITETKAVLKDLHSVLSIPDNEVGAIQPFHLSFHDFLLDAERCKNSQLRIDEKATHRELCERCMHLLSSHLKRNICHLEQPGALASSVGRDKVNRCLPGAVQYACRHWVTHLQAASISLQEDAQVYSFLREHLLHWFEALSLMGKTSEGVIALTSLQSTLTVGPYQVE